MQNREARRRADSIERRSAYGEASRNATPRLEGWYSVHEWAEARKCTPRTIRNYIRRGLRAAKIGAAVLVHQDDFAKFLNANTRGGNLSKR